MRIIIIIIESQNGRGMLETGYNIGVEGAKMISDALKCNTTLTELNLYGE